MNKAVSLLIEWDQFEQTNSKAEIADFCRFYLAQQVTPEPATNEPSVGLLLKIMGRITSAFSLYQRAAMNKTTLPFPEGFYYLNGLAYLGETRKTDLINYLLVEYTTGMEAIGKLMKEELIKERPDESDGRAKLISLTEIGKQVLATCYPYLGKAGEMIFGKMSPDNLKVCIQLLADIEQKQSKLALELKNKDFDEMYQLATQGQ